MKESWNKIKCPYCFKDFAHNEVHFRIAEETCEYAQNKVDNANNADKKGEAEEKEKDSEEKKKFSKFLKMKELEDPKYSKVWGELRGGTPPQIAKGLFNVPWVDEHNKSDMIIGDFITDKDGFVEKIEDKCSHLQSKTRICPHCHNKLPLHYGKNPQKFISILGVSTSGKTVYVKQLMARLRDSLQGGILSHVNGSCIKLTLPDDDKSYLTLNEPLPGSTDPFNFKIPYFVTMTFNKDNTLTTYDFVIYDIAGEILVRLSRENPNRFDFFAGFIKNSDAIITIIDPKQLVGNPEPEHPASEMITTLYSVFGEKVDLPTAITISKSDMLMSSALIRESLNPDGIFFNANSPISKDIPWDSNKKYFYVDEYANLLGQLRRFYTAKANAFYVNADQHFNSYSFFAVSALFDGVDQKLIFELRLEGELKSDYVDKYIKKFNILSNILEDIQSDIKDQEDNPEANIIDKNNIVVRRSFIFDQSDEIARKLEEVLSKIDEQKSNEQLSGREYIRQTVYSQFAEDEVIDLVPADNRGNENLTIKDLIQYINYKYEEMEDCSFDVYMQGYPRSNGDLRSLRIEEPFFWLLSEMDIIDSGNLYTQNSNNAESKRKPWWAFWR